MTMDSHFRYALIFKEYGLINKSQPYNKTMSIHTSKQCKGIRTSITAYEYEDDRAAKRLSDAGEEQISTNVGAVNSLLKLYATNSYKAKKRFEIAVLKKSPMETVQFASVLFSKIVYCGNAYPEKRTKRVFTNGLLASTPSATKLFWRQKQDENHSEIAKYTDLLLEQTKQVPSSVLTQNQRSRFVRGQRTYSVVDTIGENRDKMS